VNQSHWGCHRSSPEAATKNGIFGPQDCGRWTYIMSFPYVHGAAAKFGDTLVSTLASLAISLERFTKSAINFCPATPPNVTQQLAIVRLAKDLSTPACSCEKVLGLMASHFRREWKEDVPREGGRSQTNVGGRWDWRRRRRQYRWSARMRGAAGEGDRSIVTYIKIPISRLGITSVVYHANQTP